MIFLSSRASHSHGCSPDLVITRNHTISKNLNSNITFSGYNQSFLAHFVIAFFFMIFSPCADQYIGPVFLLLTSHPSLLSCHHCRLTFPHPFQSNIKSCQLYLQIIFIYFLSIIVFPGSGSKYRLNSISQMSETLKINVGEFHFYLDREAEENVTYTLTSEKKMDLKKNDFYQFQQRDKVIRKKNKLNSKKGQTSMKRNRTHVLFHLWQNTGERNGCYISKQ